MIQRIGGTFGAWIRLALDRLIVLYTNYVDNDTNKYYFDSSNWYLIDVSRLDYKYLNFMIIMTYTYIYILLYIITRSSSQSRSITENFWSKNSYYGFLNLRGDARFYKKYIRQTGRSANQYQCMDFFVSFAFIVSPSRTVSNIPGFTFSKITFESVCPRFFHFLYSFLG